MSALFDAVVGVLEDCPAIPSVVDAGAVARDVLGVVVDGRSVADWVELGRNTVDAPRAVVSKVVKVVVSSVALQSTGRYVVAQALDALDELGRRQVAWSCSEHDVPVLGAVLDVRVECRESSDVHVWWVAVEVLPAGGGS